MYLKSFGQLQKGLVAFGCPSVQLLTHKGAFCVILSGDNFYSFRFQNWLWCIDYSQLSIKQGDSLIVFRFFSTLLAELFFYLCTCFFLYLSTLLVYYNLLCYLRDERIKQKAIQLSHGHKQMVDGAEFWISCKRLKALRDCVHFLSDASENASRRPKG